jgi:hypothetical protein
VAIAGDGEVLTSTRPAAAGTSWQATAPLQHGSALTAISCASPSLCVAVGEVVRRGLD